MIQHQFTISLYFECVGRKLFSYEGIKLFCADSERYKSASDEEMYEVWQRIKQNYPNATSGK